MRRCVLGSIALAILTAAVAVGCSRPTGTNDAGTTPESSLSLTSPPSTSVSTSSMVTVPTEPAPSTSTTQPICEASPSTYAEGYPIQSTLPKLQGTNVAHLNPVTPAAPDSDDDGEPDTISIKSAPAGSAQLVRGDGALSFASPGYSVVSIETAGDLDGNGRDWFSVQLQQPMSIQSSPEAAWLIAPTTRPGAYDPREVGVRLPAGATRPVADRDGDGNGDLLVTTALFGGRGTTEVFSSRQLTRLQPRDDARNALLLRVPGGLVAVADLGRPHPTIVTADVINATDPTAAAVVLRLVDDRSTASFTTAPKPYVPNYSPIVAQPKVVKSSEGTYLELDQHARWGAATYRWRVDQACSTTRDKSGTR